MYAQHYQLRSDPFRLTPDPDFSFAHQSYGKAWAYMQYALRQGEGFLVITGRPGSGKTTLIRSLMAELQQQRIAHAVLVSTRFEAADLVPMVAHAFGLQVEGADKVAVLKRLEEFLKRHGRGGRPALLLIDEAQGLSADTLQELYRLTNLYEGETPLLQVFLVGQDQLRGVLHSAGWGQLRQRMIAACHIEPLDLEQTHAYIRHRLVRSGWRGNPQLSDDAVRLIHHYSEGLPRRINTMCSRLLLFGSVHNKRTLDGQDVHLVVEELRQERLHVDEGETPEAVIASAAAAAEAEQTADQFAGDSISELEETFGADAPEADTDIEPVPVPEPEPEIEFAHATAPETVAEAPTERAPFARRRPTDIEFMDFGAHADAAPQRRGGGPAPERPGRRPAPNDELDFRIPGPRRFDQAQDEPPMSAEPYVEAPPRPRRRGMRVLLMLLVAAGLLVLFRNFIPQPVDELPSSQPTRADNGADPKSVDQTTADPAAPTATAGADAEPPDAGVLHSGARSPQPAAAANGQGASEPAPATDAQASADRATAPSAAAQPQAKATAGAPETKATPSPGAPAAKAKPEPEPDVAATDQAKPEPEPSAKAKPAPEPTVTAAAEPDAGAAPHHSAPTASTPEPSTAGAAAPARERSSAPPPVSTPPRPTPDTVASVSRAAPFPAGASVPPRPTPDTVATADASPAPRPVPDGVSPAVQETSPQVGELLARANAAMEDYRLTIPEDQSAYNLFQQVLRLDPGNEAAQRGLAEIVTRYSWLARRALDRGEYNYAEQYVARGMRLDPQNAELRAVRRLLTIERETQGSLR